MMKVEQRSAKQKGKLALELELQRKANDPQSRAVSPKGLRISAHLVEGKEDGAVESLVSHVCTQLTKSHSLQPCTYFIRVPFLSTLPR